MRNTSKRQIFLNGLIYENPLLVSALGICSALAMTSKTTDALRAAFAVIVTLLCTNVLLSALKRVIPQQVRIPCSMLIIATVVTMQRLLSQAYLPGMNQALSDYLPLLIVNCLILGRGELFAFKNSIANSAVDALGCGAGYGAALVLTAMLREFMGSGTILGIPLYPQSMEPLSLFIMAPGGLFTIGLLMALARKLLNMDKARSQHEICSECPAASHCPRFGKGGCTR